LSPTFEYLDNVLSVALGHPYYYQHYYQHYGHRLFDRIQKQPPARKASGHLRMNGRNHRTQTRVRKLALCAQFYLTVSSVRAGHQCRVRDAELQMRCRHESNPRVAATGDTLGLVEHAIFGEYLVDGRAPARMVVFPKTS
jgi:hypothetical protein